ncbi:MAG: SUKH-3 domain-containing protein [Planctomycetaceae bacterium]|nr:SUKH-3 domain-containing protein [Planctomycetaceae bacterium]
MEPANKTAPTVSQILRRFGWSINRKVDISAIKDACEVRRFRLFPYYTFITQSLYGLTIDLMADDEITCCAELIRFDPLICFTDLLRDARRKSRLHLLPLAEIDNVGFFYIAADGSYWADIGEVYCVGSSFKTAMQRLLFGANSE